MEELIALIISNPVIAAFVEGIAVKVASAIVIDILHRRAIDPEYRAKSDALGLQYANAETDEEMENAEKAIQDLVTSPRNSSSSSSS